MTKEVRLFINDVEITDSDIIAVVVEPCARCGVGREAHHVCASCVCCTCPPECGEWTSTLDGKVEVRKP